MTPLVAYQLYSSIKLHFDSDKYDFSKYGLNRRTFTEQSLDKRNDKYYFVKAADKYSQDDFQTYLLAVFLDHGPVWIKDLVTGEKVYEGALLRWKKVRSNLQYYVTEDLKVLLNHADLSFHIQQPTFLVNQTNLRHINPETLIVLNRAMDLFELIDTHSRNDYQWQDLKKKLLKITGYVRFESNESFERVQDQVYKLVVANKEVHKVSTN